MAGTEAAREDDDSSEPPAKAKRAERYLPSQKWDRVIEQGPEGSFKTADVAGASTATAAPTAAVRATARYACKWMGRWHPRRRRRFRKLGKVCFCQLLCVGVHSAIRHWC